MTTNTIGCCARCGLGEIWHASSSCKGYVEPIVIEGKVLDLKAKFWVRFASDPQFPDDPNGWLHTTWVGAERNALVLRPKGHEKVVAGREWVLKNAALERPA